MSNDFDAVANQPLKSSEDFRVACDKARLACLNAADALYFLAKHIHARLKAYEKWNAKRTGRRAAMWRPRFVAVVMLRAASLIRTAAKLCDKTWRTYLRHYGQEMHTNRYKETSGETTKFKV